MKQVIIESFSCCFRHASTPIEASGGGVVLTPGRLLAFALGLPACDADIRKHTVVELGKRLALPVSLVPTRPKPRQAQREAQHPGQGATPREQAGWRALRLSFPMPAT